MLNGFRWVQLAATALVLTALIAAARDRLRDERRCVMRATLITHCEDRR